MRTVMHGFLPCEAPEAWRPDRLTPRQHPRPTSKVLAQLVKYEISSTQCHQKQTNASLSLNEPNRLRSKLSVVAPHKAGLAR